DVAICVPFGNRNPDGSLRWVPPEFSIAMLNLKIPTYVNLYCCATKGRKRDESRNDMVKKAQKVKARYVWMVDDDNPPPPSALMRLMYVLDLSDDDVALCGGIYT